MSGHRRTWHGRHHHAGPKPMSPLSLAAPARPPRISRATLRLIDRLARRAHAFTDSCTTRVRAERASSRRMNSMRGMPRLFIGYTSASRHGNRLVPFVNMPRTALPVSCDAVSETAS
jgi:hypothetical protein